MVFFGAVDEELYLLYSGPIVGLGFSWEHITAWVVNYGISNTTLLEIP